MRDALRQQAAGGKGGLQRWFYKKIGLDNRSVWARAKSGGWGKRQTEGGFTESANSMEAP